MPPGPSRQTQSKKRWPSNQLYPCCGTKHTARHQYLSLNKISSQDGWISERLSKGYTLIWYHLLPIYLNVKFTRKMKRNAWHIPENELKLFNIAFIIVTLRMCWRFWQLSERSWFESRNCEEQFDLGISEWDSWLFVLWNKGNSIWFINGSLASLIARQIYCNNSENACWREGKVKHSVEVNTSF